MQAVAEDKKSGTEFVKLVYHFYPVLNAMNADGLRYNFYQRVFEEIVAKSLYHNLPKIIYKFNMIEIIKLTLQILSAYGYNMDRIDPTEK